MEKVINNAIEYIKGVFEKDFSGHDFFHSLRVYKTALVICEQEGANELVVSLAALLHDVDDIKLSPNTYEKKENAVSFMMKENIPIEVITQICEIISEVSFKGKDTKKPTSIESKCVQDADRLDALGAIGIARTFAYGGSCQRPIYNPDINPRLNMSGEEYKNYRSTSINHFYEKLFVIKDLMNTNTGKKIANQREEFMRRYIDEFLMEWNGEDMHYDVLAD